MINILLMFVKVCLFFPGRELFPAAVSDGPDWFWKVKHNEIVHVRVVIGRLVVVSYEMNSTRRLFRLRVSLSVINIWRMRWIIKVNFLKLPDMWTRFNTPTRSKYTRPENSTLTQEKCCSWQLKTGKPKYSFIVCLYKQRLIFVLIIQKRFFTLRLR